jgi:hypothetical protein
MTTNESAVSSDPLAELIEADREGRALRIFTRSSVAGPRGTIGRAVGYRVGHEARAMVFRVDETETELLVELVDVVRVERV